MKLRLRSIHVNFDHDPSLVSTNSISLFVYTRELNFELITKQARVERPDSSLRLEYPSPKLGLGLESENLRTRDPNESKITVKMGKKCHFWAFTNINIFDDN